MSKFGETMYPGAATASIVFMPMHTNFFEKDEKQVETDGFIALDIGGGKYDIHASTVPTSSAMLESANLGGDQTREGNAPESDENVGIPVWGRTKFEVR
ncbi:MAG: hypothetical protein ACE5G1_17220 [bacterium]